MATPLVDDGFMYMVDAWGVVYKIDVRSGTMGRIVWKMDPGQEKIDRNRGVALWGNLVISVTSHDGRVIATDKETGKIVWDKNLRDQPDMTLNAAPLALAGQDHHRRLGRRPGRAQLAGRARRQDRQRAVEDLSPCPAPGEPGSETWKDKNNAWQTGGGAFYVTGSYDPDDQHHLLGRGQPGAEIRFVLPARRQSLHQQRARDRRGDRQDPLVPPVHAERHDGLRRDRHATSSSTPR